MSRIVSPNLEVSGQITSTGIALINCLADDIYEYIEMYLESLGTRALYLTPEGLFVGDLALNMRDPSSLFKVLSRSDYPVLRDQFRSGLNRQVPQQSRFDFYNKISEILDDRHDWIHKNIAPTVISLRELIQNVRQISSTLKLPISDECAKLSESLKSMDKHSGMDSKKANPLVQEIQKAVTSEEPAIGSGIEEAFLEHSYTLHTNGQIRYRKTEQLLEDQIGDVAGSISALLVARKPTGGRLKITSSGLVCGYFDGTWGYLMKVMKDQWFPGHL